MAKPRKTPRLRSCLYMHERFDLTRREWEYLDLCFDLLVVDKSNKFLEELGRVYVAHASSALSKLLDRRVGMSNVSLSRAMRKISRSSKFVEWC